MIYLLTALVGLVAVTNMLIFRDRFSPAVVCAFIWFGILFGCDVADRTIVNEISWLTGLVVLCAVLAFSVGALADGRKAPAPTFQVSEIPPGVADKITALLFVVTLVLLPIYIRTAMAIAKGGYTGVFLIDLRWALEYGNRGMGPILYASTLSLFMLIWHFSFGSKGLLKSLLIFALAMTYAVLSTGRQLIILSLIGTFVPLILRRRIRIATAGSSVGVGIIAAFFAIAVLLRKGGNVEKSFLDNIASVSKIFAIYALTPLAAFDHWLKSDGDLLWGVKSFRFIAAAMHNIDDTIVPVNLVQKFVAVPQRNNVYTVLRNYTEDFGIIYTMIVMALYGFLTQHAYRRANEGAPFWKFFYTILFYALIIQFFDDQYISMVPGWLYLALLYVAVRLLMTLPLLSRPWFFHAEPTGIEPAGIKGAQSWTAFGPPDGSSSPVSG